MSEPALQPEPELIIEWVDDFGTRVGVTSADEVVFEDSAGSWRLQPVQNAGGARMWHRMCRCALGRDFGTIKVMR